MASPENDASTEAGAAMPGAPPKENLFRALAERVELIRAEGDPAAMPTLTGRFSVFNQWTEINSMFEGRFMERFAPGAFAKTIAEQRDGMRVLFQHGHDPQIGDKVLGPIADLREDGKGAYYEVPLLDTSYNRDLIPGLEAGLYGASFRFKVMREEFVEKPARSKANPDGLPERTVTEAQVREFGPVTFPAYAGATAGVRSMTDEFMLGRFVDNPERLQELIEAVRGMRAPEPSEATTPEQDEQTPEPPAATTSARERISVPARLTSTLPPPLEGRYGIDDERGGAWQLP